MAEPCILSKELYISAKESCITAQASPERYTSTKQVFSDLHGRALYTIKRALYKRKRALHIRESKSERYTSTKRIVSDVHGGALYSIKRAPNVRKRALHYRTSKSKRYTSPKKFFPDWLGKALYLIKRALYIRKRALYIRKRVLHYRKSKSPVFYEVASVSRIDKLQVSPAREPCKRDDILQKRPKFLSILLTVATPYRKSPVHICVTKRLAFVDM